MGTIGALQGQVAAGKQAAEGMQKLLGAAATERARLTQENTLLKRAVEVHNARAAAADARVADQKARLERLSALAEGLYAANQSMTARITALTGGGSGAAANGLHYPSWGDTR